MNKILSNYLQSYILEYLIEYILINKKSKKINKKSILLVKDELIQYALVSKYCFSSIQSTILQLKPYIDFENDDKNTKKWWLNNSEQQQQQQQWSLLSKLKKKDILINCDNQIIQYKYEIIDHYDYDQLLRIWSNEIFNGVDQEDEDQDDKDIIINLYNENELISKILYNICIFINDDQEDISITNFSTLLIADTLEKRTIETKKLFVQNIEKIESRNLFELIKDCNTNKLHIAPSFSNIEGPVHLDYQYCLFVYQHHFKHIKLEEDYLDPYQLANIYKQQHLHTLSFKLACHEIIKECFYFYKNKRFGKYTNIGFELYDDGSVLQPEQKEDIQPLKARTDLVCKCEIDSFYPSFNLYDIVSDLKAMVIGICKSKSLRNLTLKNRCHGLCFWEHDIVSFLESPPETNEFYTINHCLKSLISNSTTIENLKFENFDFTNEFILSGFLENQSIKSIYFKNSLPTIQSLEYLLNHVITRADSNINHLKISYDLVSDLNKGYKNHHQFNKSIIEFLKSGKKTNLHSLEFPIDTDILDDLLLSLSIINNNSNTINQINLIYFKTSKIFPNSKNNQQLNSKINQFNCNNNNNMLIRLITKTHVFNSK